MAGRQAAVDYRPRIVDKGDADIDANATWGKPMIADLLLLADALLFLVMGVILAAFPGGAIASLGLPAAGQPGFYRRLLGAALIGVGLAQMMNALPTGLSGLGLNGAMALNLCVASALALQLLTGARKTPARGKRLLWLLVLVLLGLSAADSLLT